MTDPKNGSGGSPPEPANDQVVSKETRELAAAGITATMLKQLFPHVPDSKVIAVAQKVTMETPALREQVLSSVIGSGSVNDVNPNIYWGVKIHGPVGVSLIHVPKKLPKDPETMLAWQYSTALGLLMDPLMRGTVILSGLKYEFFQTASAPPGQQKPSGIIV